jgi:hypothetical protein
MNAELGNSISDRLDEIRIFDKLADNASRLIALGHFSLRVLRDGGAVAWSVAWGDVRGDFGNSCKAPGPPHALPAVADWRGAVDQMKICRMILSRRRLRHRRGSRQAGIFD